MCRISSIVRRSPARRAAVRRRWMRSVISTGSIQRSSTCRPTEVNGSLNFLRNDAHTRRQKRMRKTPTLIGVSVLGALALGQLNAAAPDPAAVQKVVDARVAKYKQIGKANKAIRDE